MKSSLRTTIETRLFLLFWLSFIPAWGSLAAVQEKSPAAARPYAATYFGGNGTEFCSAVARDDAGNVYVTGYTTATDFPKTAPFSNPALRGKSDMFVMKFAPDLKRLLASALIGGEGEECGYSIFYDRRGFLYVAGYTGSPDFPTTPGAYAPKYAGGEGDAFILKMDPDLKTLAASTYLGGSGTENDWMSPEIVLDREGRVVIAGKTSSPDFPTTPGAFSEKFNGGGSDAFVSILDADLKTLEASTFIGGSADDGVCRSLRIDPRSREICVAGVTLSANFPLMNNASPFKGELGGFVVKISPDLSRLTASAVLPDAFVMSLLIHENGDVYVGGHGGSALPTTPGAYYRTFDKHEDQGFISRFSPDLSKLESLTVLPGTFPSGGGEVACLNLEQSPEGDILSVGWAKPRDFPTTPGAFDESPNGGNDTYALKMNKELTRLLASTFIGGSRNERWNKATTDGNGNLVVAGYTLSKDFPTSAGAAFEKFNGGDTDGFLVRIDSGLGAEIREDLHEAAGRNDVNEVRRLLAADRNGLERSDRTRRTPLHVAARYGALETARYLIDQGAKVNVRDEGGNTPLHPASLFGHASIVEALAAAGADINALNDEGSSPLALAVVYGPASVVDWLLSHKADPSLKDRNGDTPLHLAATYGNREKALAIVKRVTDIDIKNGNGKTPLQAMLGNTYYGEIAQDLLARGASLTATDGEGKNALHLASVFYVREPYIKLFLEKGGAANSRDRDGNAPLHLILMEALKLKSVYPSLKEKITSLLEHGADPALKNNAGKSPMDLAREIGDKTVLDLVTGR